MYNSKNTFLTLSCIFFSLFMGNGIYAQHNSTSLPQWYNTPPSDTRNHMYFTGIGEDYKSKKNAGKAAEMDLMNKIANKKGCSIQKPEEYFFNKLVTKNNIAVEEGSYGISIFKICDGIERVSWKIEKSEYKDGTYYVLAKVDVINNQKAAIFSIVPGAGQFYKKEPVLGTTFLIGSLGSLGMMAHSFSESAFYKDQIPLTRDTQQRIMFQSQSDTWNKRALSFGIASGILYGASIAHAAFAKKKNRLYADNYKALEVKPYYAFNSTGISFAYNLK